jgi:hypothetical protein
VSPEALHSHAVDVDVLVALNQETADIHLGDLVEGAAIVYDPSAVEPKGWPEHVRKVPVPLDDLAIQAGGSKIMRNTVANAAVLGLLKFPLGPFAEALEQQFARKKPEIAEQNVRAAQLGYDEAGKYAAGFPLRLDPVPDAPPHILVDGNEAFGLGALNWDYGNYTWHTDRDTFDKIVFDDLKSNATLTAMFAYLASEDPALIAHINPDSARAALAASPPPDANAAGRGGRGFGGPRPWPTCEKAPRSTNPRLR